MFPNPAKTILEFIAKDKIEPALLAQVDYLKAENTLLIEQLGKSSLTNSQRAHLAELGIKLKHFSKDLFESSISIVKPETLLKWHRKFVAQKFDGSKNRNYPKQKRITKEIEYQIVKIARDDVSAGYDKIVGYLSDLGINFSKTSIANILKKHGINPSPKRKEELTWKNFIKAHKELIWGCDFFTKETWTINGLVTYYILIFIHLGSRRLVISGITTNPTAEWTIQQARQFYDIDAEPEILNMKYLIRDKGSQFTEDFDKVFGEKIKIKETSYPQMNSYSERVIQSIQNECTERMIFVGEKTLKYALKEYQEFYNQERHHQGIDNNIPLQQHPKTIPRGKVKCKTRLGGLLRQYYREAA